MGILLAFPIITNCLAIASARLADSMQQNFGSELIALLVPVFTVVVGIQVVEEIFSWLRRTVNWLWQNKIKLLVAVERQKKKATFTIPFIDSEDYDQLNQRIEYSGAGFDSQVALITRLPDLIRIIINIIFSAVIVYNFNPSLVLVLLLSTLPGFTIAFTESFAIRKEWENKLTYNRITGVYEKHFSNYTSLKDTKASGSASYLLDIFRVRREYIRDSIFALYKKYVDMGFFASLLSLFVGCMVQYFVIKDVVFGTILIGQATLVIAQAFRLQYTLQELAWFLPEQHTNVLAAKYLFLYLTTEENIEATTLPTPTVQLAAGIKISDVAFEYPEVEFKEMRVLTAELDAASEKYFKLKTEDVVSEQEDRKPFTLTIPTLEIFPGERVAIVGKNGHGKTTFIQLVLNLYQPTAGTVAVFGNILKDMNQADVQKYYSVLFQDYAQTNLKVHEYIGLSEINDPNLDRVRWAADQATATDFIEKWKDKYTQQLGVPFKGVKPSKGQWQKLALARAFYKDAPIMILDEPTSAIDAISAKTIFEKLAVFDPAKILLFVCHNMTDVPVAATRILVFDEGKIVGDGTHNKLLKTCMVYKELYTSEKRGKK
jgi:ATP-binding cassette subfamily B protein